MIVSCLGGVLGALFAILLSERIMNVVACISLIFAFMMVLRSNKWIVKDVKETEEQRINKLVPFAISMYDGGFGPGSALMNITYFLKNNTII